MQSIQLMWSIDSNSIEFLFNLFVRVQYLRQIATFPIDHNCLPFIIEHVLSVLSYLFRHMVLRLLIYEVARTIILRNTTEIALRYRKSFNKNNSVGRVSHCDNSHECNKCALRKQLLLILPIFYWQIPFVLISFNLTRVF